MIRLGRYHTSWEHTQEQRLNLSQGSIPAPCLVSRFMMCEEMRLGPRPRAVLLRMAETHHPPPVDLCRPPKWSKWKLRPNVQLVRNQADRIGMDIPPWPIPNRIFFPFWWIQMWDIWENWSLSGDQFKFSPWPGTKQVQWSLFSAQEGSWWDPGTPSVHNLQI